MVYSVSQSVYSGAFFEYVLTKATNSRAGSIFSTWNGTYSTFVELSTTDIGNTSEISFLMTANGSNAILSASASSDNWIIKTILRTI